MVYSFTTTKYIIKMSEDKKPSFPDYNRKRAKRLTPSDRDYVSNKDLFNAIVEYRNQLFALREKDPNAHLEPSEYIVNTIMLICQRRLNSYNFSTYSYRDEMLSDAYLDCFRDITKFNPEKSQNPFSYFTSAANNAFKNRIKNEKAYLYTKYRVVDSIMNSDENEENIIQQYGSDFTNDQKNEYMHKFEKSQADAKERGRLKKLERDLQSKKSLIKKEPVE